MTANVPISFAAYKRRGFPEAITVNCFAEKAPTQQSNPLALIARSGLEAFKVVGTAPLRAIYQKQGLFDNAALIVARGEVYTLTDSASTTLCAGASIPGTTLLDMDAGQDADLNSVARIATGSALYKMQDNVVSLEDFPVSGGAGATSVCYHRTFWFAVEAGTDQCFYQIPGDTTWHALSFVTAEYQPDKLVAVRSRGDQVVLLGEATTEVWALTGVADPAIAPYGGLNFDFGCKANATAVNCKGALIWVDNDCCVRMFEGGDAAIISDNGLSEQIQKVGVMDLRASTYSRDQHTFYILTLGTNATWVYDLSTKLWHRRDSAALDYWRAHLFTNIGGMALAADAVTAQVWRLDPDRRTDGAATFTVEFCAFVEALGGPVPCANVQLACQVGASPLAGQGSSPLIVMTMSDDGGETYGPPKSRSMGQTGKYKTFPKWNGLSDIRAPQGRIFKFQISEPVGRRFSDVLMNVP